MPFAPNILNMLYVACTLAQVSLVIVSSVKYRQSVSDEKPDIKTPFSIALIVVSCLTACFNLFKLVNVTLLHRPNSLSLLLTHVALVALILGFDALTVLYCILPDSWIRIAVQMLACVRAILL